MGFPFLIQRRTWKRLRVEKTRDCSAASRSFFFDWCFISLPTKAIIVLSNTRAMATAWTTRALLVTCIIAASKAQRLCIIHRRLIWISTSHAWPFAERQRRTLCCDSHQNSLKSWSGILRWSVQFTDLTCSSSMLTRHPSYCVLLAYFPVL